MPVKAQFINDLAERTHFRAVAGRVIRHQRRVTTGLAQRSNFSKYPEALFAVELCILTDSMQRLFAQLIVKRSLISAQLNQMGNFCALG